MGDATKAWRLSYRGENSGRWAPARGSRRCRGPRPVWPLPYRVHESGAQCAPLTARLSPVRHGGHRGCLSRETRRIRALYRRYSGYPAIRVTFFFSDQSTIGVYRAVSLQSVTRAPVTCARQPDRAGDPLGALGDVSLFFRFLTRGNKRRSRCRARQLFA